jgi:hypothetical protein
VFPPWEDRWWLSSRRSLLGGIVLLGIFGPHRVLVLRLLVLMHVSLASLFPSRRHPFSLSKSSFVWWWCRAPLFFLVLFFGC